MTVLFDKTIPIQAGLHESAVFDIPAQFQQPGQQIKVSMGAEQFPDGTTSISVFISTDGGNSYRSAATTVDMPTTFRGAPPHFWNIGFALGENEIPTNAKYATDAPAAFSTRVIIETS